MKRLLHRQASLALLLWWLLPSPGFASGEAAMALAVLSDDDTPTWLGLIDVQKPAGDIERVLHLPIKGQARIHHLAAGSYRIDHIDFSQTIAGDERTVRIEGTRPIEMHGGVLNYPGDLYLSGGQVRFVVNWQTIDALCQAIDPSLKTLNIVVPGSSVRRINDACDSVNVSNP